MENSQNNYIKAWGFAGETPTSLLPDNTTNLMAIGFETNDIKARLSIIREETGLEPIVIFKYNGFADENGVIPIYVIAAGHFRTLTITEILFIEPAGTIQARLEAYRQMHQYVNQVLGYRVILK